MRYLKGFTGFLFEEEKKGNEAGNFMSDLKELGDLFKNSGLASFLNDFTGDGPVGSVNVKAPTEAEKLENIKTINTAMDRHGVKDKNLRAAILGVVGNESGFGGGAEESYYGTKFSRMQGLFTDRVSGHESDIEGWRKQGQAEFDKNFWELVYGRNTKVGKDIGNTEEGDGAKYRGRGFHQLTGKGEYKLMQDIYNKYRSNDPDSVKELPSIDIVSNPDTMADPKIGAEICVLYFISGLQNIKNKYPNITLDGPNDKDQCVSAIANINAGLGANMNTSLRQSYIAKAKSYQEDILSKNLT
jgi:predicted chitinase